LAKEAVPGPLDKGKDVDRPPALVTIPLMQQIELKHIKVRPPNPFAGWERKTHWAMLIMLTAGLLLVGTGLLVPEQSLARAHWPDALLLLSAAGWTLTSLSLQRPAQNVLLAAVVIGLLAGAVQAASAATAVPFGPIVYNKHNIGNFLFDSLPWALPVIWIVVLLNSRGVARLMLRSRRRTANYGFWVIGLTIVLVILFVMSFEPYATVVKQYWSWKPTKIRSDWYGTPWVSFLGWAVTTLLILLFVTPALISKSPTLYPPAYHPLILWEILSLVFLAGEIVHHLRAATGLTGCQMLMVALLSLLGSKSKGKQFRD
jgi:hypothetical protein